MLNILLFKYLIGKKKFNKKKHVTIEIVNVLYF